MATTKKKTAAQKFEPPGATLVFEFENQRAAAHFKSWLCGSGEQQYWEWMEYREQEEGGPITGIDFNYHSDSEKIPVKCGRKGRD